MTPEPRPTHGHTRQRGEGQIGCILSLLALAAISALTAKVLPVFYSNSNLVSFAEELGGRGGLMQPDSLLQQLRGKAKELGIPEALAEGALTITSSGSENSGVCTIHLVYRRQVDLFGITTYVVDTDKTLNMQYIKSQ